LRRKTDYLRRIFYKQFFFFKKSLQGDESGTASAFETFAPSIVHPLVSTTKKLSIRKSSPLAYLLSDYFSAVLAWTLFFSLRKILVDGVAFSSFPFFLDDRKFYAGILIIPACWLIFYFLCGSYTNIYRKSRLTEVSITFIMSLIGCVIIFFALLLDDHVINYTDHYLELLILFIAQLGFTLGGRLIILNIAKYRMQQGIVGFNTLIVGGNKRAIELYKELSVRKKSLGYNFVGFVDTNGNSKNGLSSYIPRLGKLENLQKLIPQNEVEEVIVAIETSEHPLLKNILYLLTNRNVVIKIIPDNYDIISGSVRLNRVVGGIFIEIYPELMDKWQYIWKRILDIFISLIVIIVLSPIYLFVALRTLFSSKGPIIYSQERLGVHQKPFTIYKFRSMYVNAEKNGPLLSHENDSRITPWGRIMRKWRLDELPQFYNVLKGDMSLVGPRPERKFYIDQIIELEPDYLHLQRVKPGITSWGMVQFGYAENIDEMIQRMKYDLLYIENMSLFLDWKILLHSIRTILQGRGK
jgi:polysaccharide biosynthesis protein PslA